MRARQAADYPPILFISLRGHEPRRRHISNLKERELRGLYVEYVEAVQAKDLSFEWLRARAMRAFETWELPRINTETCYPDRLQEVQEIVQHFWLRELTTGEVACSLSHYKAWTRIIDARWPSAVIFEDDVRLFPYSVEKMKSAVDIIGSIDPTWDLLYFGRLQLEQNEVAVSSDILQAKFSYCTHAYAIARSGALKLASARFLAHLIPVDEYMPSRYIVHPRRDVDAVFGSLVRLKAYATCEYLADQVESFTGKGSGSENSSPLRRRSTTLTICPDDL